MTDTRPTHADVGAYRPPDVEPPHGRLPFHAPPEGRRFERLPTWSQVSPLLVALGSLLLALGFRYEGPDERLLRLEKQDSVSIADRQHLHRRIDSVSTTMGTTLGAAARDLRWLVSERCYRMGRQEREWLDQIDENPCAAVLRRARATPTASATRGAP